MAQRKEARIFVTIWDDPVFRAHSPSAQRMYFYLLSQVDLSYCGVIPLRERRWARDASGLTVDQVMTDLEALAQPFPEGFAEGLPEGSQRPLIVIDDDTGEVLVRSLIRHDGIWKIPNLLKSARESAALVRSPQIKAALVEELQRLPLEESSSEQVNTIVTGFIADLSRGLPNPRPNPPAKGSANPSAKGSDSPSAKGSQGIGERNVRSTGTPQSPVTPEPLNTSTPATPHRDDVARLCTHLADRITANGAKRPAIGKKWHDAARLMLDADGRTESDVHAAIDWCQDHEFWRANILSMPKLREKYDQLSLQAQRQPSIGTVVPIDRRQQATNDLFDRAMDRARTLDAQEAHGEP